MDEKEDVGDSLGVKPEGEKCGSVEGEHSGGGDNSEQDKGESDVLNHVDVPSDKKEEEESQDESVSDILTKAKDDLTEENSQDSQVSSLGSQVTQFDSENTTNDKEDEEKTESDVKSNVDFDKIIEDPNADSNTNDLDKTNTLDENTDTLDTSVDLSEKNTDNLNQTEDTNVSDKHIDASQSTVISDTKENPEKKTEESEEHNDSDVGKPNFESAPNVTIDDSQDDHSQDLDPFDALLKDLPPAQSESTTSTTVNINDDDDDHNADDHITDDHTADDHNADDDHPDTSTVEEGTSTEPLDEPGADEEVCLLPDTEREISEADKAEAEKVLAEKRRLAEEAAAAAAEETAVPKVEGDNEASTAEGGKDDGTEDFSLQSSSHSAHDNENGAENVSDSERDEHEEPVEIDENSVPSVIQEISPLDGPCIQCQIEQPCSFRFTREGITLYVCNEPCVKAFQAEFPGKYSVTRKKYLIEEISSRVFQCSECEESKLCYFYYNFDGEDTHYCSLTCLEGMMADEKDKYAFKRRRITIHEKVDPVETACLICNEIKPCKYHVSRYGENHYLCQEACIKTLNGMENGRYFIKKIKVPRTKKQQATATAAATVKATPLLKLKVISNATDKYLDEGYKIQAKTPGMAQIARQEREMTFVRKCKQCQLVLTTVETLLSWETMDFCNEKCLGKYQNKIGAKCANCRGNVIHTSLGKYCVRFGYDIRQFCNSGCLEEFKKGLKICCYCQRDISAGHQGFLAPVGDKGQFKDFCTQQCMEKFDQMSKKQPTQSVWVAKCAVCSIVKPTTIEVEVGDNIMQRLCSDPCFAAFKFVNNIFPDQCRWCKKYFERKIAKHFTIHEDNTPQCFCSISCINVYISNTRHIVPCNWCKVKKYNFDMIMRIQANGQKVMMCSLNCLNLYQVSINAVSSRKTKCDMCKRIALAQYHLTMSDATVRNFCTYQCVMSFQSQYSKHPPLMPGEALDQQKAVPTGAPRRTVATPAKSKGEAPRRTDRLRTAAADKLQGVSAGMPVISNVQSLAAPAPALAGARAKSKRAAVVAAAPEAAAAPAEPPPPPRPATPPPPPPPKVYNHVIVKTLPPHEVANKATMSKPMTVSRGVSCRPHPCTKECQTDPSLERRVLIPVPVPIYVPVPCAMWSLPFPVPVPIPIPIPTPVFIPTTRNSAKGIMKEINKIHDKMPTDPFEAEILMMAEMVAGDKKKDHSDSDTDDDNADEGFSPVAGMDGNNAFGEDMLQMALKMATEYEDQPVDLESAMTANTITPSSHPGMPGLDGEGMHHHMMVLEQQRAVAALRASGAGRKRGGGAPAAAARAAPHRASKRRRADPPPAPDPPREPQEKPDANMCLKYTFGVNAWKQWVMTKNAEIEKSTIRRKPFKSEILQLTADELNYSLCLFVKEVRKPNGSEYAPDTIYYLVLGIQQYLFENGRIDNIFTDPYYEKFTDCLDEVARKFSVLYNDSQYIVTRVEEEHLWESKQLGAHSPHVLLSTLMFFNTKHFNLVTVEEHMQLSFSHIMKHWKRNPNQPGQAKIPGSRNVLLRFYPPQSALEANSRKKKVYEQQENEENPLRCPVKLYEFYISKCPESVRTRNDVFYLQPERSCVPDSPVWYSTQPLSRTALAKMLHRVKMVKEINIALLTS